MNVHCSPAASPSPALSFRTAFPPEARSLHTSRVVMVSFEAILTVSSVALLIISPSVSVIVPSKISVPPSDTNVWSVTSTEP